MVTQAWAEVQHNIIYKTSNDIQATPTMKRMIDAINGLAITTDIMLAELERSRLQAEKEAEVQRELEKDDPHDMLLLSILKGDHRAVKRLLGDEIDVNTIQIDGIPALHVASSSGYDKVVEQLLVKDIVFVNAKDKHGWTALHWASRDGHDKVVGQLLVQDGVDVNAKDELLGETALQMASQQGHDKVVKRLLAKDGVDVNAKKKLFGQTALRLAFQNGHDKVVEQLRAKGGLM